MPPTAAVEEKEKVEEKKSKAAKILAAKKEKREKRGPKGLPYADGKTPRDGSGILLDITGLRKKGPSVGRAAVLGDGGAAVADALGFSGLSLTGEISLGGGLGTTGGADDARLVCMFFTPV